MGVPMIFRNATIAKKVQKEGYSSSDPTGQKIPAQTVARIVDELPAEGAQKNANLQAKMVIQIADIINANPPGSLGTVALTLTYALSWIIGIIALVILFLKPFGNGFQAELPERIPEGRAVVQEMHSFQNQTPTPGFRTTKERSQS